MPLARTFCVGSHPCQSYRRTSCNGWDWMLLSTSSLKFRQLEIDGANGELYQGLPEYFCGETGWQCSHHLIPHTQKRSGKHLAGPAGAAQEVCRAHDTTTAPVEHMGVYHRRPGVAMSEEFLDGTDVIPRFEAMGGKGM